MSAYDGGCLFYWSKLSKILRQYPNGKSRAGSKLPGVYKEGQRVHLQLSLFHITSAGPQVEEASFDQYLGGECSPGEVWDESTVRSAASVICLYLQCERTPRRDAGCWVYCGQAIQKSSNNLLTVNSETGQ